MIAENRGPQGAERRRDPRREVTVPARLTLVGLTVDGRLANVSARGVCFLTTNPHLRVAESNFVRIRFTLPPGAGDGGDAPGGEVPGGAAPRRRRWRSSATCGSLGSSRSRWTARPAAASGSRGTSRSSWPPCSRERGGDRTPARRDLTAGRAA